MELSEIDARIAQLKSQIAEKEAYQKQVKEAYHNPYSKYHYGYIYDAIMGDRSGLDREAAEEAAYQKLLMEQAQADKIRAEQAYNTAYENKLNQDNAVRIAKMNRTDANTAKLEAIEKELNNLLITKQTLDAQGKDSREVTARIEQIYKRYPEIERPDLGEYDPETDVNYVLAKSGEMNYVDNPNVNELEGMLATVKTYRTPEAAKERVRLEREIIKRNKAAQFKAKLDEEIANYWKTGIMGDLMLELGFEEAGVAGNRHLLQGKKIIRRPKKKGGSTPSTSGPIDT